MRSTITLYRAGSPIHVPPMDTNSARMPSFLPSSFTLSINAGGNVRSDPQRRPTSITILASSWALADGEGPGGSPACRYHTPDLYASGHGFTCPEVTKEPFRKSVNTNGPVRAWLQPCHNGG